MLVCTFRRYDEAVIAAKATDDPKIAASWREHANKILEGLLDGLVEVEAQEALPVAWAENNPWDCRLINKSKWEKRKQFRAKF